MTQPKYKINTGFIIDKVGKDKVVYDGERSILHTFNETAFYIFRWIKKGYDEEQIVNKLITDYHVDHETAQEDIENLINDLLKKRIIGLNGRK